MSFFFQGEVFFYLTNPLMGDPNFGANLRDVSISDVQKELICQGVYLQKKIAL